MAYRSFTLPPLKLTRRPSSGAAMKKDVHRATNQKRDGQVSSMQIDEKPESGDTTMGDFFYTDTSETCEEPTMHEIENKASVTAWKTITKGLIDVVVESQAMLPNTLCILCETPANVRCKQCGPRAFFCIECFEKLHQHINIFHIGERWEGDHYVQVQRTVQMDPRKYHACSSKRSIIIICIDEYGIEHSVDFICCDCEPLPLTLARAELWPATPSHPRLVFTFRLLDWAEALLLESHVALKDFCNSLHLRCPVKVLKRRGIYKSLINCFEVYRYMRYELRHLKYLCSDLDAGNVCPACPKENGKIVYAMDAVFGLPRKKSAGKSHCQPLHGNLCFQDQLAVDEFLANYKQKRPAKNECSDFVAGSMLRSNSRYRALDETAVFGYACRHEFPGKFLNLKHGERLGYAVWILDSILEEVNASNNLYIMYDIACNLSRHLKVSHRSDVFERLELCLPTFHSYGHKVSCQVLFGPRRCVGIGLSDGETMERLWSYLRRYGKMTKEMRPTHRIDVLTDALIYYGIMTKKKLAKLLLSRWERAKKSLQIAEEAFNHLMPPQDGRNRHEMVEVWLSEEKMCYNSTAHSTLKPIQWQSDYYQNLHLYYQLRSQLLSNSGSSADHREFSRLDKILKELEREHSISVRWSPLDKEYVELESKLTESKQEQLLLGMWKAARRRKFLLKLKAKYADGQKIAKRLAGQVGKEVSVIKGLLQEYNMCTLGDLSLEMAMDPSFLAQKCSKFELTRDDSHQEVIEAYLMICRSKEELTMLESEVGNAIQFYSHKKQIILKELERRSLESENSDFNMGARCLLCQLLVEVDILLTQAQDSLHPMQSHADITLCATDSDDTSCDDSDNDSD